MPAEGTVRVRGLRELSRAFARAEGDLKRDLRDRLKDAAEPVREDAEELASSRIRNIGPRWQRMRVGVTQRLVYVAPRERGVTARGSFSRRRPNLAPLLMDQAMQPALDRNRDTVIRGIEDMLDDIGRDWEHG